MAKKYFRMVTGFGLASGSLYLTYSAINNQEKFFSDYVMPLVHFATDGETAHNLAVIMAKYGLVPKASRLEDEHILKVRVFNKDFENPIGCAAGFDKNAEAINGLFKIGFGFVEVGTITPLPQEGNPKPRVFRLVEDQAVINRYGFNSEGHQPVYERIQIFKQRDERRKNHVLGINIGKNKLSLDAVNDYLKGVELFSQLADYLVINISSPNTPGLRNLQNRQELENLVDPVMELRDRVNKNLPILIKIAPDLNDEDLKDIAKVSMRKDRKIDGLIVSNTTISRPDELRSKFKTEQGGLSGKPLKELSNKALKRMYELTSGQIVLIGVGGIQNGSDALEKIKNGASLVQLYTSMVYEGPTIVSRIKRELITLLKKEGFSSVSEAIGANLKR